MAITKRKNITIFVDDVQMDAVDYMYSLHADFDRFFAAHYDTEYSFKIQLKNGTKIEANPRYCDVESDTIYLYGVFKPIETLEDWQKEYLTHYAHETKPYHKASRLFQSEQAKVFKKLFEHYEGTIQQLREEIAKLEEEKKELKDRIVRLRNEDNDEN